MTRIVVGPVSAFPPGERRFVQAGRRSIGVFRVDDRFFAIRNRCPHQGAPLCTGIVDRAIVSTEPGRAHTGDGAPFIACPWHGWEYDLATGQSYAGAPDPGVRAYAVSVESGADVERACDDPHGGRVPGPYVVETFPVTVEEDYVVVEV